MTLERSPKIVVVGAGIAGLTAAYRFQNKDFDVEIYEARARVGGRIFSVSVNSRIAELGAHNINDGGEAVHLNRLIDEFELERTSNRVQLTYSYFDGKNILLPEEILKNRKFSSEIIKEKINRLALSSSNMKEVLDGILDAEDPLYKVLAIRMAVYEGGAIDKLSPMCADTLYHMILGGLCSVHQGAAEVDCGLDLVSLKGGNSQLPKKIAENLGQRVHLNMPLIKITKDKDDSFRLVFKNGKEIRADILVLAIPCTVYKQITFGDGVIPSAQLDAIKNVQYGQNSKILVPFTTSFFKHSVVGKEIISSFSSEERTLTIFSMGESSLFSKDTIGKAYADARDMIEMQYGKKCPPFSIPKYAEDKIGLSYDGPVGYSWPNDPYAGGSYSYIAEGQEDLLNKLSEENGEIYKTLFVPVKGKLYFAGEHATILSEVPGTMEAACETGERIARAILKTQSL